MTSAGSLVLRVWFSQGKLPAETEGQEETVGVSIASPLSARPQVCGGPIPPPKPWLPAGGLLSPELLPPPSAYEWYQLPILASPGVLPRLL